MTARRNLVDGNVGGRGNINPTGKAKAAGISLTPEVFNRLQNCPQVAAGGSSKSYLVDQALRSVMGFPADLSPTQLRQIFQGNEIL